jgi:alpha-ketoglutarate-dependent taurine dioxygenase
MSKVHIEKVKPHIGGIVHVTKEHLFDDETAVAVRDALEDRGVLVFPRMNLTDQEQLAFTDKLGKRVNFTRKAANTSATDDPDVYAITLDKKVNPTPEYVLGTFFWHIDGVTIDHALPKATLLTARKLAPTGGQTEFASTYAAYEYLPEAEKQALQSLKVVHNIEAALRPVFEVMSEESRTRWRNMAEVMVHPLVWTHNSGRKSLIIGTQADFVLGQPIPHGRSLLVRLQEWAAQPDFSYRHHWQEGDLVIWDNCGAMHRVVPYDQNSGRLMHRTTIAGEERVQGSMPYKQLRAAS